ncbi:hypothetical protein VF14_31805 [Nostoc linckia z18]|uniref:Uncharacterized protein n=2 Tax=Nostoc linckia TaxID=92942 RepID=A0A9Q5Z5X1_NOSLI|nr:hypothetical protein [Nostoc linckia]PHK03104.1 hypothetical protein VF09_30590 [Nostoc linckia z9]PHK34610.1 hypothetical protein VF12_23555 [Nostoc linckia z15]PHK41173.1 hypothetical protein VF13_31660 [Nostoc linckia z16]PHJ55781.1 hypothetical protein VF02_35420 [Nostoc linckia z1]PHJ56995.1 hypothetical protein VF05_36440 [Nostoc linckia z3]
MIYVNLNFSDSYKSIEDSELEEFLKIYQAKDHINIIQCWNEEGECTIFERDDDDNWFSY